LSRRTDRVGDLLRREIVQIVRREMADPRVRLATVTAVEVTADLSHARVRVSTVGDEESRVACVQALQHAASFIRRQLAHSLDLRTVPKLDFVLDRGAEHSLRISQILEGLDHVHDDDSS